MKRYLWKMVPCFLGIILVFTGCGTISNETATDSGQMSQEGQVKESDDAASAASSQKMLTTVSGETELEEAAHEDTDQDTGLNGESDLNENSDAETSEVVYITMNGDKISSDSESVDISGTTITITEEGTYSFSGSLEDGSVIVDTAKDAKVRLILNGVSIQSQTFAPIYVIQADKVTVTLAEGTENYLINGGSFVQIDDNHVDAVIFSKDDLKLNGSGSLWVESTAGHGIVGKDDITITGGTYTITVSNTAIRANDSIEITDGTFYIVAGTDGLHAENDEDESQGSISIQSGTFTIDAQDDAIHATTTLVVDGGVFEITASEGMEATNIIINGGEIYIEASDDGINAGNKSSLYPIKITINGGDIIIIMGAGDTDGVDANGDIEINGGSIQITANSAFDFDNSGVINGGTVVVNGEVVTVLTNQMMGGMQGGRGGRR